VFHPTSAVLSLLGDTRRKHSGVEAAFNELLVKPGHIEAEYSRCYREARRRREDADYSFGIDFTEQVTREVLANSVRLVARLERFLTDRGYVKPDASVGDEEASN
jgi:uncharacterized protein (UPF0332 family)